MANDDVHLPEGRGAVPAVGIRNALAVLTIVGCGLLLPAAPSTADVGETGGPPPTHTPSQPPSHTPPNVIPSQVRYTKSYKGSGARMTTTDSAWSPPACWYEPEFKPAEFEDYINSHWVSGSAFTDMATEYGADNYHKGEKGAWYQLVNSGAGNADSCIPLAPWRWFPPSRPSTTSDPVIDPKTLAGLAYNQTTLPVPPVELRPDSANQLVNLDTELTFGSALKRVWTTAELDNPALGVDVAATTVAVPVQLRVDAGTDEADPRTCTYDLTPKGGTYGVDTRHDACNVTYRKASPAGGYPLTASIVWKVTWTPSSNPDGPPEAVPPLPNGESTTSVPVTVRENEAVNR